MAVAQEKVGQSAAIANHDHDMVHELNSRLDAVWRYDQYIANAEGKPELQQLWQELKDQDTKSIERLKSMIGEHVKQDCF